jgi:SAM-dependent methyltransferase
MCNQACEVFAQRIREADVRNKRVLEVGSRNVNGSLRVKIEALHPASYLGIDIEQGPGVDELCGIDQLIDRYGEQAFDVIICTEVIEHVRDWRGGIQNLKAVLRPDGALLLTTRSSPFPYHGFPFDFWRFEVEDMRQIFADMTVDAIEPDPSMPGVFVLVRRPAVYAATSLSNIELYSVVSKQRCAEISSLDMLPIWVRWAAGRILPRQFKDAVKRRFPGVSAG